MPAHHLQGTTNAPRPLYSVIIPVHNRARLAIRAIESVLAQTEPDFEVIAVDDASTDNSWHALSEIKDPRVRVARHPRNLGGSAARNTALRHAQGTLIAFLDSDDYWLPTKLETCARFAQQLGSRRWVLYHQYYIDSAIGRQESTAASMRHDETLAEFLFVRMGSIQTSAVVVPRELALQVMWDERLPRLQDWDFYLRAAQAGAEFRMCPNLLAVHDIADDKLRISSKIDPDFLLRWIEDRRHSVSRRAYAGYLANKVAPEATLLGRRVEAALLLLSGLGSGVTRPRAAAIELARLMLPPRVFNAIRRARGLLGTRG